MDVELCRCTRCQFSFVDAQARAAGMRVTTTSRLGPQPKPVKVYVHPPDPAPLAKTDPVFLVLELPYLSATCSPSIGQGGAEAQ